jgi:hypothetical protein
MSDVLTYDNAQKTVVQIGDVVMAPGNIRGIVIGIQRAFVTVFAIGTNMKTGETFVLTPRYIHDFPASDCMYLEKQTLSL